MANNYQISATQLRENEIVLVKGNLVFSRLSRLVEGEDLARVDAQRVRNGMQAIGRPHTSVTIANAEVIAKDPANPTIEEQFVAERRYASKKHPEHGLAYGIDNKSTRLPVVAKLNESGQAEQVQLAGELASDVPVILVLRTYKPRNYSNKGLSLDQVIIQDTEVKYFSNSGTNDALAAAGITFAGPIIPQQAAPAPAPTAPQNDSQVQAAQAAGAWPTAGNLQAPASTDPFRANAAPVAQPTQQQEQPAAPAAPAQPAQPPATGSNDDIEALRRQLAEAEARNQANQAGNSAFNPQPSNPEPIQYNG